MGFGGWPGKAALPAPSSGHGWARRKRSAATRLLWARQNSLIAVFAFVGFEHIVNVAEDDGSDPKQGTAVAQKYWDFMKYGYETNHIWASNVMTINMDTWKKLTPAQQATIERVAREMEPQFWETSKRDHRMKVAELASKGMTIAPMPKAVVDEMLKMADVRKDDFVIDLGLLVRVQFDARQPALVIDRQLAGNASHLLDDERSQQQDKPDQYAQSGGAVQAKRDCGARSLDWTCGLPEGVPARRAPLHVQQAFRAAARRTLPRAGRNPPASHRGSPRASSSGRRPASPCTCPGRAAVRHSRTPPAPQSRWAPLSHRDWCLRADRRR